MNKSEMYKYNLSLVMAAEDKVSKKYGENVSFNLLKKSNSAQLTYDKYTCFCRIYISENIDILVRLNTLNVKERSNYRYFDFKKNQELDLNNYSSQTLKLLEYILSEAIIMPVAMEERNEMTPSNATNEELKENRWYDVWERRLLEIHDYNNQEALNEWFERCTNPQIERERSVGVITE